MKAFFLWFVLFSVFCFSWGAGSRFAGIFSMSAFANISCQPIYGGGQACVSTGNIVIDKKVLNPQTQLGFVDSLGINDPKYQPGDTINFQINLTNTGNTEIKRIDVKDVFPQFVTFTSGPGNFDANTKTLSFEVNNLKPNETRSFEVVGKVVSADQLPIDQGAVCVVIQAMASTTDSGMSQDNAQFCIQKEVLGAQTPFSKAGLVVFAPQVTQTPATGPESLALFSLLPTGIIGWYLRKYALKKIKDPIR